MMSDNYYQQYTHTLDRALSSVEVTDLQGGVLGVGPAFEQLVEWTLTARDFGYGIYFIGNGASAMMSSHMAVDFCKNGGLRSFAFNDPAFLTAISNDISYDEVFSLPLRVILGKEDVLVTISSSGNSPSIVKAIEYARSVGVTVVTFSGMKPDNRSRSLGNLNFYIPANTYGIVECSHQVLLHVWLDKYLSIPEGGVVS